MGNKNSVQLLLSGLKQLKYRGYDSVDIASLIENSLNVLERSARFENFKSLMNDSHLKDPVGIVHNRWATHENPVM